MSSGNNANTCKKTDMTKLVDACKTMQKRLEQHIA
jgi:hypothetical protein